MKLYSQWPGELGTRQTIGMMIGLVNKSYLHPLIRARAFQVAGSCDSIQCVENSLTEWVRNSVRYFADPPNVEALYDPLTWVETRLRQSLPVFGDCDDMSIYLATLLKSAGHSPQFLAVSRYDSGELHHILVFCHGRPLDATVEETGPLDPPPKRAVLFEI